MIIDETLVLELVQDLTIACWIVIEEQLTKFTLGTEKSVQKWKWIFHLNWYVVTKQFIKLLNKFKDIFAWTYKDLKGTPPEIVQHKIKFNITISHLHQARYQVNPNYVTIVKHDINKLLVVGFIKPVEEATWLLPIVVVLFKNGKLWIYVVFRKFDATTKMDCYSLPFTNEVINIIVGHEVYTF